MTDTEILDWIDENTGHGKIIGEISQDDDGFYTHTIKEAIEADNIRDLILTAKES